MSHLLGRAQLGVAAHVAWAFAHGEPRLRHYLTWFGVDVHTQLPFLEVLLGVRCYLSLGLITGVNLAHDTVVDLLL